MPKLDRPPPDPELKRLIQELIAYKGGGYNPEAVEDIIENALKLLSDVKDSGDVRVIQTALAREACAYAFKLFAPYAQRTNGRSPSSVPARTQLDEAGVSRQAVEFGRKIARSRLHGHHRRGGRHHEGRPRGAGLEHSFGANIRLPWEQSANPVIQDDKKLITFKYFFTRKLIFVRHSDAIALFPGGFGTMDEGYEALTLMQTEQKPVDAAGVGGPSRRDLLEDVGQTRPRTSVGAMN